MSWNIPRSALASVIRQQLPQMVTQARDNAPESEKPLIELAGQSIWESLKGIPDDALVDMQFHGSDLPSQDARVFLVSVTTRRIKPVDETPKPIAAPWVPSNTSLVASAPGTTEQVSSGENTSST